MTARRFTLTTDGAAVAVDGGQNTFNCNGRAVYTIKGSFGGGTVKIQAKINRYYDGTMAPDSDFANIANSSDYTTTIVDSVEAAGNIEYRFFLSGATTPNIIIDIEIG